jgi:hypothetical protein
MKSFISSYPGRDFTVMFYADDDQFTVDEVQAFMCPPNDEMTRWVPEKGYSVCVGGRLFPSRAAAEVKLRQDAAKERDRILARLKKVEAILR